MLRLERILVPLVVFVGFLMHFFVFAGDLDAEKESSVEPLEKRENRLLKSNDGGAWGKLLSQCAQVPL